MTVMNTKLNGTRFTIGIDSESFPSLLRETDNPPEVLYGIGDADALSCKSIAVVGSRRATPYGLSCAERFASILAEYGACVVTGGARGIDTQALRTALAGRARAIVVLGCGCDHIYPQENRELFQKVIDNGGAIVSEQPWSQAPIPYMFVKRNRIIAGLSLAMLVCESGLPSGTFSACDYALAAGRDVLAVPGPITSPQSQGCNALISQGAVPMVDDAALTSYLSSCGLSPEPQLNFCW